VFLCQSAKLVEIEGMELLSNCKLKLECDKDSGEWKSNTFSVSSDEIDLIVKSIFRDFVRRSLLDAQSVPEYLRLPLADTGLSLNSAVQELIREKQALSQRIVDEHEQIYGSVARDLHDAVINNVLAIKRLLGSEPDCIERVSALLDDVYLQLRDICNDMAPRDLQACGLQLIIDDLVERFAETASLDAVTDWCCAVPDLPPEVQMHIYRVVQECLNNVAKHSTARHVWVRFAQVDNKFTVVIEDDGKRSAKPEQSQQIRSRSGRGRGIMAERAQLMNRLRPTTLRINTDKPQGFKVELSIEVR
jgi:signal transduction histidine kinase